MRNRVAMMNIGALSRRLEASESQTARLEERVRALEGLVAALRSYAEHREFCDFPSSTCCCGLFEINGERDDEAERRPRLLP